MEQPYLNYKLLLFVLATILNIVYSNLVHRRFEYKYSFKPPYLAQKDGSVPFWEYGGNAIASSENVRIAPSLRSQKGAIWTKNPTNFDWWDVDIAFRISGRGRVGADGLAFWYTTSKGAYDGDVFGSSDKWVGLGVLFDSFDNDNKHNNPYIMAVINDGTRAFDHQNDATTQAAAGCLRDFRNKPFPTKARVEYYQNTLTLLFNNGMTNDEQNYEMCFRLENVLLPKNGYFGLSAATGGLADDHDVLHFLTHSLHPPGQQQQQPGGMAGEEQQKLTQEYQEYQKKLELQKEEYRREHPDEHKEQDPEDWFETDNQRELRQIFQGQSQIYELYKELNRKLDEVLGKQERTLSLVSVTQNAVLQGQPPPQLPPGQATPTPAAQGGFVDTIRRHEVDAMFQNQNQALNTAQELKQLVLELRTRSETIINNQAKQPTAQVQSVGYDSQALISEMRDGLNHMKQNFAQLNQKVGGTPVCPTVSCVSVSMVLIVAAVQLAIIVGYNIYRDNKENQAKKFY